MLKKALNQPIYLSVYTPSIHHLILVSSHHYPQFFLTYRHLFHIYGILKNESRKQEKVYTVSDFPKCTT